MSLTLRFQTGQSFCFHWGAFFQVLSLVHKLNFPQCKFFLKAFQVQLRRTKFRITVSNTPFSTSTTSQIRFGAAVCTVAGFHARMGCYHTFPEGFTDILMFRTLPYSSLERSVAPLGPFHVLHSKECANVTLCIRRSYRSEITNIWRSFLSHGVIYLSKFYTQFAEYLFMSFIDGPKSWHFILQKCLLCLIWRVDLKHNICKQNKRTICL